MLYLKIYLELHRMLQTRFKESGVTSSVLEKKEIGRKIIENLEPNNIQK